MTTLDHNALARWRANPVSFIEEMLVDPETGQPFQLLPAERQFLTSAFATTASGRLRYPELLFGAVKKSGKTALAAMHLLTTTLIFGGRYAEGYAVANDLEQAQSRVFAAVRRICECSPHLRREAIITQSRIEFPGTGATIRPSPPTTPLPPAPIRCAHRLMNCGAIPRNARIACGTRWCRYRPAKSPAV